MRSDATSREVTRLIPAHRQTEGAGFVVRRPLPSAGLEAADPFLLIDEMGPADYAPGEAVGAPDHPHRGFETVTYMLEGAFEHHDSSGGGRHPRPGAAHWMAAGARPRPSPAPPPRAPRRGRRHPRGPPQG